MAVNVLARLAWSRVLAFVWLNEKVLDELRKDPKETITQLAKGQDGKYKNIVDTETANQAKTIQDQTENDPTEPYRGYLPIPDPPLEEWKQLSSKDLAELLRGGITGILKFDDQPNLWADELLAAWNDPEKLIKIRQDPLGSGNLIHKEELLKSKYKILPVPDRPRGIDQLNVGQLESFLGDEDNMSHLGGIFLFGS